MSEHDDAPGPPAGTESAVAAQQSGRMYRRIERKVREALAPAHLEIFDESHMHGVPQGAESHFRLLVVAEAFAGESAVQRHQAVYRILAKEMRDHIHALGLQTLTPEEWTRERHRNESPECLGGSKAET